MRAGGRTAAAAAAVAATASAAAAAAAAAAVGMIMVAFGVQLSAVNVAKSKKNGHFKRRIAVAVCCHPTFRLRDHNAREASARAVLWMPLLAGVAVLSASPSRLTACTRALVCFEYTAQACAAVGSTGMAGVSWDACQTHCCRAASLGDAGRRRDTGSFVVCAGGVVVTFAGRLVQIEFATSK